MAVAARKLEATAVPAPLTRPARRRSEPSRRPEPGRRPAPARRRSGTAVRRNRDRGLVGRTAHVVTGLPESLAVRRMTKGRAWIAVIGVLLIGIVAINVVTVSYGAMSSRLGTEIEALQRQNSILSSQTTRVLSMPRVRSAAVAAGMAVPETDEVIYREYDPSDIAAAAQRLAAEGG